MFQELPVLLVTQGAPIDDEFTLKGQELTGWTARVAFRRRYPLPWRGAYVLDAFTNEENGLFLEAVPTVTVVGADTVVALSVADTSMFPANAAFGHFVTALAQYRLTGPDGAVQVYQRPVAVAGVF